MPWTASGVAAGPFPACEYPSACLRRSPATDCRVFVKGKVGLKWRLVEGVTEYSVYRRTTDSDFAKISTTEKDHFFDTDLVPGALYTYKVSAVGSEQAESFSAEKSVAIPGATEGEFVAPKWVGLRVEQGKVLLNWDPVPTAIAYNILRGTSSGGEYEVVGNSQTSKYADNSDLVRGQSYYYALTALNADFEESAQSEELSIKFGLSKEEQDQLRAEKTKIVLESVTLTPVLEITEAGNLGAMNQPADVFVNAKGNIYVTDALNARVHCFDPGGRHLHSFGEKMDKVDLDSPPPGTFLLPFTLFIDSTNQVYVADVDAHDIQLFSEDGQFVRRIRVDTGPGMEPLRPNGIHVLDDGRIVTTDTGNHRFLILDQQGKILLSKGSRGGGEGEFNFPDELTVTADNTICIVDVINCRVQEFDLSGKFIRQFGGVGATAGTFARPKAITVDGKGRLWISDAMSNVIQGFTVEGEVKTAVGVAKDESIRFITPRGIFFHGDRFYVVNRIPNRVVVYRID